MERAQRGTRMPPEGSASTDPRSRFDPANRPRGNNNPTVRPPPLPRATGPHITSSTIEASIPPEGGRTRSPSMNLPPQRTLPPEHQEAMAGLVNGLRSSNRGGGGTRRRLAAEPVSVQVQPARETPAPRSRRAPEVAAPASETAPLPAPETPAPVRTPRGHRGAAARAQASEMSSGHVEDPGIPRQSAPASFSPPAPGVTRSRAGMGPSAPSAVRNSNPIAEMAAQVTRAARSPLAPYSGGGRTSGESESARAARERVNGPRRRDGFAGASGINHGAFSNAVGGGLVRGESNPTPIQSNHGFGRSNVKF